MDEAWSLRREASFWKYLANPVLKCKNVALSLNWRRLRVVPYSFNSPSCPTRKKTATSPGVEKRASLPRISHGHFFPSRHARRTKRKRDWFWPISVTKNYCLHCFFGWVTQSFSTIRYKEDRNRVLSLRNIYIEHTLVYTCFTDHTAFEAGWKKDRASNSICKCYL